MTKKRHVLRNYYLPMSVYASLEKLARKSARSTRAHASLLLEEAIQRAERLAARKET